MESLRGPTNSSFFGQKMSSECLEQAAAMVTASTAALDMGYPQVSFLQMLNAVTQSEEEEEEDKKLVQFQIHQRFHRESNLQRLLEIQARYARPNLPAIAKIEPFRPPADQQVESCVTHASSSKLRPPDAMESVGYIKSAAAAASVGTNERKKRKRSRVSQPPPSTKNAQEVESQRMNHIAVERNRRRLMNSHLSTLRSLMPQSFVQRVSQADQASIIARAIDFVKELEQLLLSLQAKKRMRTSGDATATATTTTSSCSASSSSTNASRSNDVDEACHVPPSPLVSDFLISPQYTSYSHSQRDRGAREEGGAGVDVEATVVQGHANLKIVGRKRRGQVVRGIAALEEIGLPVLHLNIASLDASSILYSLNLKVEEECKLGSADEIATAVYQIFSYINPCCD